MDVNSNPQSASSPSDTIPDTPGSGSNLLSPQRTRSFSIPATPDPFETFVATNEEISLEQQGFPRQAVYKSHPILISLAQATQSPRSSQMTKRVSLVEALDFDKPVSNMKQLPFATSHGGARRQHTHSGHRQKHPQKSGVSKKEVYNTDEEGIVNEM